MINSILNIIKLYKAFSFSKNGTLTINYKGSYVSLTQEGDIIINAKRSLIHNYRLQFNDCPQEFIDKTTKAYEKGELEDHIKKSNLDKEIQAEINVRH